MLFHLGAAIALALLPANGLPTDQHVLSDLSREVGTLMPGIEHVREELKRAEIIPTVIDDFFPLFNLSVKWSPKNYASLGNTLKPSKLQDPPNVTLSDPSISTDFCSASSKMQYIITLTDPDAPSRDDPKWSEMCHWIAAGIPAPALLDLATGMCSTVAFTRLHEIMPYKPPGPPPKTGKHRYVFLAFVAANRTEDKLHLSKPKDRQHWGGDSEGHGVRDWAKENGLVPVAANFIYAQNEKQ